MPQLYMKPPLVCTFMTRFVLHPDLNLFLALFSAFSQILLQVFVPIWWNWIYQKMSWTALPLQDLTDLTDLHLDWNRICNVTAEQLSGFASLIHLNLRGNCLIEV